MQLSNNSFSYSKEGQLRVTPFIIQKEICGLTLSSKTYSGLHCEFAKCKGQVLKHMRLVKK